MRGAVCPQTLDAAIPLPHLLFAQKPPTTSPPHPDAGAGDGAGRGMGLSQEEQKRIAAHRAVEQVESGMVVGLGTGSTAAHALDRLGELLRRGALRDVVGIPTSLKTAAHAAAVGIPLSDLDSHPRVDLSIDGADEVDPSLNLVKGRGGSLLREKMIEAASDRFVVIVDDSKLVPRLGASALAVPVEVVPFCHNYTLTQLKTLLNQQPHFSGAKLRTAADGAPFLTDNSNYIIDLYFEDGITGDLNAISDGILRLTGVVEHGMFLGIATEVIVANKDGSVVVLNK
ncbi:putative ribose-5-phosphate isomerase 2 [Ananas comosus]|uniref:ribose-5-phosphate isomerase n=1 Tax=Ananas comosus TaxID=4615 RepID=A0A199UXT6_ANACO|nr:putative ribose-5-phosphate isomerase 2 [Ananas comosus]